MIAHRSYDPFYRSHLTIPMLSETPVHASLRAGAVEDTPPDSRGHSTLNRHSFQLPFINYQTEINNLNKHQ